jgi:hypothetical protein
LRVEGKDARKKRETLGERNGMGERWGGREEEIAIRIEKS